MRAREGERLSHVALVDVGADGEHDDVTKAARDRLRENVRMVARNPAKARLTAPNAFGELVETASRRRELAPVVERRDAVEDEQIGARQREASETLFDLLGHG